MAAGVLALLLLALGFLPLFGGPRYEAALLAGLIGPGWVACVTASATLRRLCGLNDLAGADHVQRKVPFTQLLSGSLSLGFFHAAAVLAVAVVHGLIGGFCEPVAGFLLLLLGPVCGILLASLIGPFAGVLVAKVRFRRGVLSRALLGLFALALPLASAALEVSDFYRSPTVYAYDAFAGYFAGPLYDTVEYDLVRLLVFRTGTLATGVALWLAAVLLVVRVDGSRRMRVGLAEGRARAFRVSVATLGLFVALGAVWHGASSEELGLRGSTEGIRAALGRQTSKGPCRVHFSRGVSAHRAQLIAKECVGHLSQLGSYFDVEPPSEVDIYLFESSEQKRLLMGAGRTYIAKPWRREIYIQPQGFPHPVLGHELAHVVTGEFGVGPLKVAGSLRGLIMDPGRVEGFAEAASPREHSEGTLHQWTAAMKQLELLPPLQSLFKLGFFGNSAARSYSASGSFVDFLREAHGADVIKAWYAGADLAALTGKTWETLEGDWHAHLDAQKVPEQVLEIARPKFSRPGIFQRRCPHAVDRAVRGVKSACGVQEAKARRHHQRAVSLDATKVDLDLYLPRCRWAGGDTEGAEKEVLGLLSDEGKYAPEAQRAAFDFLGNARWLRGDLKGAKAAYESALSLAYRSGLRRQYDVKLWALTQGKTAREAVRALLVPKVDNDRSPLVALSTWNAREKGSDVAAYLLARQASADGRISEAVELVRSLEVKALPAASLKREARRMKVLLSCRDVLLGGEASVLEAALKEFEAHAPHASGLREARRVVERCTDPGLKK